MQKGDEDEVNAFSEIEGSTNAHQLVSVEDHKEKCTDYYKTNSISDIEETRK